MVLWYFIKTYPTKHSAYCMQDTRRSLQLISLQTFVVEEWFLFKLHCYFAFYAFELDEKEIINSQ